MEWQPIEKRANDTHNFLGDVPGYLCLIASDKAPDCGYPYMVANGCWLNENGKEYGITHWMPLPPPPKGE